MAFRRDPAKAQGVQREDCKHMPPKHGDGMGLKAVCLAVRPLVTLGDSRVRPVMFQLSSSNCHGWDRALFPPKPRYKVETCFWQSCQSFHEPILTPKEKSNLEAPKPINPQHVVISGVAQMGVLTQDGDLLLHKPIYPAAIAPSRAESLSQTTPLQRPSYRGTPKVGDHMQQLRNKERGL